MGSYLRNKLDNVLINFKSQEEEVEHCSFWEVKIPVEALLEKSPVLRLDYLKYLDYMNKMNMHVDQALIIFLAVKCFWYGKAMIYG